MIPSETAVKALWDKYNLPLPKRTHAKLVSQVVLFLVEKLKDQNLKLRTDLLLAAALLHDIDKNAAKLPGEQHPDAAVRILQEEGMDEVAQLVKTHPLHAILDPAICPRTWEEKILFLADKMVKHEIITVDERFALWRAENLPVVEQQLLEQSLPLVKELEAEIFGLAKVNSKDVGRLA